MESEKSQTSLTNKHILCIIKRKDLDYLPVCTSTIDSIYIIN